ncbi:flagellar biosynthesis protein FlgL, partial [Rhizobium ruizarguesonis]
GVYADIGVSLGGNAARSLDFSLEVDRIASIKSSNSLVTARMESSQLGLSKMKDVGDGDAAWVVAALERSQLRNEAVAD